MINFFPRITILYLVVGIAGTIYPQKPEWEKLASPVNTTLRNLSFVNCTTGWASGELGTIIKTSDGGRNWQVQDSGVPYFITDLSFVDEDYGWAVTVKEVFPFNTIILKTTNGGEDWVADDFQDSSAFMRTVFFFDSLCGFIGGSYIAATTDGGSTWTQATIDSSLLSGFPVYKFKFYNKQFGYACGGVLDIAGVIWRTTNSGYSWTAEGVSPDQVYDLFIFDSLNAITLSGDPEGFFEIGKIRTTDSGLNWEYDPLSIYGLSFALDFRTAKEGWSASGFKLLSSSDFGETWTEKTAPDSAIIFGLQFIDSLTGFAVGGDGAILRYVPPPVSVTNETKPLTEFKLYQNYPNPFNPTTKIKFKIPQNVKRETSNVILKVYDVLGNEIAKLVNEDKPAGSYGIEFEGSGLPGGIYFYRLQAGNFIETKKMVLIK
jgi:photosystem II stability/assembly factor-like uncharacterized protein